MCLNNKGDQILISPLLIFWIRALGLILSTVHPIDRQVPNTDLTVPVRFFARDFSSTVLAIFLTCSRVRFPLWVTFLTFLRSRSYPPNSLMMSADEVGWTEISAALFWHLSWTITLIPFHLPPSLTISSPTFLALRPRGPNLGARVAAGPGSPPNTLMWTAIMKERTESDFGGVNFWWHRLFPIIYFEYLIANSFIKNNIQSFFAHLLAIIMAKPCSRLKGVPKNSEKVF